MSPDRNDPIMRLSAPRGIYAAAWDVGHDRMLDCRTRRKHPCMSQTPSRLHWKDEPVESRVEIGAARNCGAGGCSGIERTALDCPGHSRHHCGVQAETGCRWRSRIGQSGSATLRRPSALATFFATVQDFERPGNGQSALRGRCWEKHARVDIFRR
jgi:hypothetical protein